MTNATYGFYPQVWPGQIVLTEEVADWFLALAADDQATAAQVQAAIYVLAEYGPSL